MSAGVDEQQILAHVEALIKQLYGGTSPPDQLVQVQQELQEYQRQDPLGWVLADGLFNSADINVRFFAALTFVVKINQKPLGDDDLSVLSKLLAWLLNLAAVGERQLVLRKVSSALVALFAQPQTRWQHPVRHVVFCMSMHSPVAETSVDIEIPLEELLTLLDAQHLRVLLAFQTTLAQDITNIPHNSHYSLVHARLKSNVNDVVTTLRFLFQSGLSEEVEFHKDVLDSYQAWIAYVRESFTNSSEQVLAIKELLSPVMGFLLNDKTFETAAEFFIDLFTDNDDKFISTKDLDHFANLLQLEWGQQHLSTILQDSSDEGATFSRLVLSFGQAIASRLVKRRTETAWIMDILHYLTRAYDHSTIDQGIGGAICDFWDEYTLEIPWDGSQDGAIQAMLREARGHWKQAIGELCHAAALPIDAAGELDTFGTDHPMSEFRSRVRSSVQASYDEFGVFVLDGLISTALDSAYTALSRGPLEVALYCLSDLSTSMEYNTEHKSEEIVLLEKFFGSAMFATLTDLSNPVPHRLRKRAIAIIGDQEKYFATHPDQLMIVLDKLFIVLNVPQLADVSALAIRKLADASRVHLIQISDALVRAAKGVMSTMSYTDRSKECIVTATAYVAQAMAAYSAEQQDTLDQLLDIIFEYTTRATTLASLNQEERQRCSLTALELLKAVGRATQDTQQLPIYVADSDSDEGEVASPPSLEAFNSRVLTAIASLMMPREDGNLLEAACAVITVGYKEHPPGYFQFQPSVTADLITTTPLSNPRLDEAIRTAGAFLLSRNVQLDKTHEAKIRLILFVCTVVEMLGTPNSDPELAHYCVVFISRLIPMHAACLEQVPHQHLSALFTFTLHCLQGNDFLPKKAAAQLWNALVGMTPKHEQNVLSDLVNGQAPDLIRTLTFAFGGDAARSELDVLARTYRQLQLRQPSTKHWTEQALALPNFPSQRASSEDKRRFVGQLVVSRDDKTTERIVREFWSLCRGTPSGYG